ncbi:MAG: thiamine pyrophosphate-binding protein [Bacteroidota bacterium]
MATPSPTTVADRIAAYLAATGIDRVFVYPGGTIAPLVNGFVRAGIAIDVYKHEQGAAFAALAVARLTGRPQVVMVTSGPGVTNALTPLADAYYDSTPVLLITGQIGTGDLRSGRQVRQRGFQEVPTVELVKEITKAARCPMTADEALAAVPALLATAVEGRAGPVVLDMPMDVQRTACPLDAEMVVPASAVPAADLPAQTCAEIAQALAAARRPVVLLGHGALTAGRFDVYAKLAEKADAVVVSSLLGLGAFATDDPRFLGFIGHTGHAAANRAVHEADFLLALGTRLDIRQTGTVTDSFVANGKVAWINSDADELAYPRVRAQWAVNADAGRAAAAVLESLPAIAERDGDWLAAARAARRSDTEDGYRADGALAPKEVLRAMARLMGTWRGVVTTGVGNHQQWAARHLTFGPSGWRLLTSAGHGTMGYDLPSAIGAALAVPGEPVLCVVGDGSLLMNIQELASLAERKLPVKVLVLNNSRLGIVSQFQRITWGTDPMSGDFPTPDFAAIARGFGIAADTLSERNELESKLAALWNTPGPALLNVHIDHDADVVPMLLGGQKMDEMWNGYTP